MIANMIAAPHDMMEHHYRTMLYAIFEIVKQSPPTIYLYKVASHVGVVGNQKADKLAVGIAKGIKANNLSAVMGAGWTGLPDSNDIQARHVMAVLPGSTPPGASPSHPNSQNGRRS
jgi:hypothetical protein